MTTTTADQAPAEHGPTHGFTRLGHAVHAKTIDHLPTDSAYARLGKWLAVKVTTGVGSMTCAYLFALIALVSLPAILTAAGWVHFFPHFLISNGLILIVSWIAQTFLQLVLLSVIIVGQNISQDAADARAAKTFEDVEEARDCIKRALDLLDIHTDGGIKTILDAVESLKTEVEGLKPAT